MGLALVIAALGIFGMWRISSTPSGGARNMVFLCVIAVFMFACAGTSAWICRGVLKGLPPLLDKLAKDAEHFTAAANQMRSVSRAQSQGASEQAAAIQEVSAALEELTALTRANANRAAESIQLSETALNTNETCSDGMIDLTTASAELEAVGKETREIIGVIKGIAFQTRLLALNAAVESARAGEAGAGFAVVAEEVGVLASRTTQAAGNTTERIETMMRQIAQTSQGASCSMDAFKGVAQNTVQIYQLVQEIAQASEQGAKGIAQAGGSMSEIDQVAQQNAANRQELAAAADEMTSRVRRMRETVGRLAEVLVG